MTTLIMPSDLGMDMLVGSSPVVGSGFLMGSPCFSDFSSRCSPLWSSSMSCLNSNTSNNSNYELPTSDGVLTYSDSPNQINVPVNTFSRKNSKRRSDRRRKKSVFDCKELQLSLKSCLAKIPDEQQVSPDGAISPSKEKKKVSFADMLGGNLTHIKIITERPDCPPRWSADFLDQVTGGAKPEALPDQWALTFSQPASDYITWKTKLEKDNVALENVLLNEPESLLTGTVKVRNMSFQKEVIVRYSSDGWISHNDVYGTYVPSQTGGASYSIYDTFSFEVPLPSSPYSNKLEFCLSYHTDGQSFWDNNNDKNYSVVSFRSQKNNSQNKSKPKEVHGVKMDAWSEFSAWNHLATNESPYW